MRLRPLLGIAVAAAAAFACVAAPVSASATVLCSKNENPCSSGPYKAGEKIAGALAAGKSSVFENELGNVTCTKSQITAVLKTVGSEGVNPTTKISAFTQENCTRANGGAGEACALTPVHLGAAEVEQWNANFQAEKTPNGNGTYGLLWNPAGAPGYHVVCGKEIDCEFLGASSTTFTVSGGAPAKLVVAATMNTAGTTCPKNKPTWKGTWDLSSPSPLFLEAK